MTSDLPTADLRSSTLRLLSNGVYVLTVCGPEIVHAAAITWAMQVSIQPTLVLVALRRNSLLAQAVRKAHRFALNILAADQEALAEKFFAHRTAAIGAEEIEGLGFRMTAGRCPLLSDAMAWLECRLAAEPSVPGDHSLLLGEVTGAGIRREGVPMVLWQTPWSYGGVRE